MRVVLDVNVLVSALLSRVGAPGRLVALWLEGAFELVVSEHLLAELAQTLQYPKLRDRILDQDAAEFIQLIRVTASVVEDEPDPPGVSADRGDDYLIALARTSSSVLVSGDRHLLALAPALPIHDPAALVTMLSR
ncbi:MAG TPA: putative toxin-antitoxin system toxin component, PIN family [Candidatus Dormibacteraeota bacterium]|nr:putative toxin-antitoxin system toxin component, PIN family [Candidatus Dormibacteraeota bacterium]